jgi:hypothetical protein
MQRPHREPHRLAHAPHLAVAALVQLHLDQRVTLLPREHAHARRIAAHPGLELHAFLQPTQRLGPRRALETHAVGLDHAVARVHEPVRQLAVVREDEQSARIGVEPAHRKQARARRHELADGAPPLGVVERGDHADRLVEHVVAQRRRSGQRPALHRDPVALRLDLDPRFEHDAAIHPHGPLLDEQVALAARAHAALRQELVEPDGHSSSP